MSIASTGAFLAQAIGSAVKSRIPQETGEQVKKESTNWVNLIKTLIRYPVKLFAAFIFSPLLILKIVFSKNYHLFQRFVALVGFIFAYFIASLVSFSAWTIFLFIYSQIGFLSAITFLVSAYTSAFITVVVQLVVFFLVNSLFLGMTRSDVIDYLMSFEPYNSKMPEEHEPSDKK